MAVVAHIGMGFLMLYVGELGLIVPAIVYYIGKQKMSFSAKHAFQALLWCVVICTALSVYSWIQIEITDVSGGELFIYSIFIKMILAVFPVYASYKAFRGLPYRYPFMGKVNDAVSNKKIGAIACLVIIVACSVRTAYVVEQRLEATRDEMVTQLKSNVINLR